MHVLIDTQILIWSIKSPVKLPKNIINILKDRQNNVFVSYFSLLEIRLKVLKGKLSIAEDITDFIKEMEFAVLMPTVETLAAMQIYDTGNKDPFDNLIITQAITEKMSLVSADNDINEVVWKGLRVLDARS